jgi:hypothetical protein
VLVSVERNQNMMIFEKRQRGDGGYDNEFLDLSNKIRLIVSLAN